MAEYKLKAQKREAVGKNKVDKIRQNEQLPAAIFQKGKETENITIDDLEFQMLYQKAGMTSVIDLDIDGAVRPAIIKEIQRHPFKNQIYHVGFQGINMDEKIKIEVPVELINRDEIRKQPSVLNQQLDTIEVLVLPSNIPDSFSIDVQNMDYDDSFTVKDLVGDNKDVEVLIDLDEVVCSLSMPREEKEEEEVEETSAADVPVVGKEEKEEADNE
ncbi:MAG: 50S ribosomal protein L25 [Eubacteriales bacterium]|uniref:50S ribosomal protein L25 n=1 Tax=Fenollaria sp. TaxID=1965292 RepID=UPI002600023A|nr:50S ribosomal protein L25 [Fenollaria sp.]MDD7340124.1 50S ribosomal protein L25 [Eubacteriales bacterium]MDY3105548.1 50S ribosomal protein L25 [Fenollaria sp.]